MLENVKGIGPKTKKLLNNLNIFTVNDLVNYYPYRYNVYNISDLVENENITVHAKVISEPKVAYIRRNFNMLSFNAQIDNKLVKIVIYNRGYLKNNILINKELTLVGKYKEKSNTFTASNIIFKKMLNTEIEPVYNLTKGITNNAISKLINEAYLEYNGEYNLPNYIVHKYKFIPKRKAVYNIHNPTSTDMFNLSKKTLIYEEFFDFMFKVNYLKIKNENIKVNTKYNLDIGKIKKIINSLPFKLTNDQLTSVKDLLEDLKNGKKVNRLILGDVGSGKTIVAFIFMYIHYISGYQSVMMVPIEILAFQHFTSIKKVFNDIEINIEILTSSTSNRERTRILKDLKEEKIDILIGTHSLINDEVVIPKLKLVITDEQHRFGVKQRQSLENKNENVNVIYMSATPIPRTLAITIYGDMDISYIKEKPLNNKKVITKVLKEKNIKEMLYKVLEEIKKDNQVFVVVPTIEESDSLENVDSVYNKFNNAFNNKIPIEIMHGKLKNEEKDIILNNFKTKKTKILVSTTVVEVGIDIKDATVIVIFNAERFGLATLHQLRGRVGRSNKQSYAYLISDYETERLEILENETDGFIISEKDFELRSSGDMFGTRQSGEVRLSLADFKRDYQILLKAKEDSYNFIKENINNLNDFPYFKEEIKKIEFLT